MTVEIAIRDEQQYLLTVREVRTLAERCDTVEDAKSLADKATAARVYAERAKLGQDMVNRAAAAKLWAERRAGELLTTAVSHGGDRRSASSSDSTNLKDIGVTGDQSSQWQRLAEVPAQEFERAIDETAAAGPVTTAGVMRRLPGPKTAQKQAKDTGLAVLSSDGQYYLPHENEHPWCLAIVGWAKDLDRMPTPEALDVPWYINDFDDAVARLRGYLDAVVTHRKELAA